MHIENLKIADRTFNHPGVVGTNTSALILLLGTISDKNNKPTAFNTVFGYVLTGKSTHISSNSLNLNSSFVSQR